MKFYVIDITGFESAENLENSRKSAYFMGQVLKMGQACGESVRQAGEQAGGATPIQSRVSQGVSAEGGVPVLLELYLTLVGRPVSGQMVYEDDAIEN